MHLTVRPWSLTLTLLTAAACSDRSADLDAPPTGSTTTGTDTDGEGESSGSSTTGEAESCAPAWTVVLEPDDDDAIGPYPLALAPVSDDDFYVYGAIGRDVSPYLWIATHDAEGSLSGATEVDFGATLNTQLWAAATDGAGRLVTIGRFEPLEPGATVMRYEPDGTEIFRVSLDAPLEPDADRVGIAAAPAGTIALSTTTRVADNDTDAWVARMDPSTGAIEWSATWSGPFNGGWSTDHGGPVAIADDGHILALARVRQDYQTIESTLLAFDGVATDPLWTTTVIADPGENHEQSATAVTFAHDGTALTSVEVETASRRRSVISAFDAGLPRWTLWPEDLDGHVGRDLGGARLVPEADGRVTIVGAFFHDQVSAEAGVGTFLVRVDEAGQVGCLLQIGESDEYRRPTAVAGLDGLTLVAGSAPLGFPPMLSGPGWMSAIAW